ncbi:MAG: hypothetical protein AB7R55_06135 [Gemmatimonadales bacterium]
MDQRTRWTGPGRRLAAVLALVVLAGPVRVGAQEPAPPQLAVTPGWAGEAFLGGRTPLELTLSRSLAAPERLAVLIGDLDVSALVERRGAEIRYRPTAARLPSGDSEVVVFLIDSTGQWSEVGRAPLKVRSRLGLESGQVIPSLDLTTSGQLDRSLAEGETAPDRLTYQDLTLRLGFQGQAIRSNLQLSAQVNAIGVTQETQRLRFGELATDAPALDLSDYQVQLSRGQSRLAIGNVTAGNNRFLLSGFGSRGVSAGIGLGSVATLDAALVNGSNVVGWTNLIGLAESAHRIGTATLAFELMPSRPGGMRVAFSGMDGSILPVSSFNQGAATDAEESRGFGVEVAMSDARQRIRFSGGFSRSRFLNPNDPLLFGDTSVVAVAPTTRSARFGEVGLQLLQGVAISPTVQANLGATARHERVDPLYRSVGAYVQADQESNAVELAGGLGSLAVQASLNQSRDNLGEITSILTSKTRGRSVNASLPLSALFHAPPNAWYLPAFNWSWQYTRQFGEGLPVDGDFSESHVPDQVSRNQSAGLAWGAGGWNLSYRWNQSFQDNRQTGREEADFRGIVHGLSFGANPTPSLSANLDFSVERQKSFETRTTQRLERVGGGLQWQVTRTTALVASISQSWGSDQLSEQRSRNTEYQLELSQGFNLYRKTEYGTQGRLFIRYARTRAAMYPFQQPSLLDPVINWTLNAGGSFRLY